MSDFKIKVTADLDTSQVEAKLMTLQNRKITIQANANGNGLRGNWIYDIVDFRTCFLSFGTLLGNILSACGKAG